MRISPILTCLTCLLGLCWSNTTAAQQPSQLKSVQTKFVQPIALIFPKYDSAAVYMNSALVLGAWSNGKWLKTPQFAALFSKDIKLQQQNLNGTLAHYKKPYNLSYNEPPCEETGFLEVSTVLNPKEYTLVTAAQIKLRPRPIQHLPKNNATYQKILRDILIQHGLKNPKINITQLVKVDLDGDKVDEVILEATYFKNNKNNKQDAQHWLPPAHVHAGDYSILLVRSVKNNKVHTHFLGQEIYTKSSSDSRWIMGSLFELAGIADLNGDGRMEIVVADSYYEGMGARVLEWKNGSFHERLNSGCGV